MNNAGAKTQAVQGISCFADARCRPGCGSADALSGKSKQNQNPNSHGFASLSYLPIYTAVKKGSFAKRGFDVELIQMSASLTAPALLNRSVDYTTIPSTIATAAARGAPAKVIFFASVKLQHMLLARPEIATASDLAGKKIAASGFGNLTSYEIQFVIDRYRLGPKTTIVSVLSSTDRFIAMHKGIADAAIISAPLDLKGEEMG